VRQPASLDAGIYAHQVRVDPAGKMAILVTRGNGAGARPEDPGALKVFGYKDGILTNRQSVAPNGGYGFQSRNLDFHPTGPWVYLALEVQSKLVVFKRVNNNESLDPAPLFTKETLRDPAHAHHPAQQAGPVFVHPGGRFVYTTNRTNGTVEVDGKRIFEGGENTIAVFSVNQQTGEPTLVQSIDTHGMHARTFSFDDNARILVAANQSAVTVRDNGVDTLVPASLSVYRMGSDGKLQYVRKYDVETGGGRSLMWSGIVTLP
jgi:6-phosphogluconolactonase (cycloisomerase 2 family)